ncbi:MAG: hypothetical protein R6W75_13605 [Smithellaceae bacterium]
MSEFLDYLSTWSVLKWILLVLIAGFIGQFGRMMAEAIVKKARLKRAGRNDSSTGEAERLDAKTASGDPDKPLPSAGGASSSGKNEKKALKAAEKIRKKEAKINPS